MFPQLLKYPSKTIAEDARLRELAIGPFYGCKVCLPYPHTQGTLACQEHRRREEQRGCSTDLLDVLLDELEDKAAVHEGQQVMQEKGQAGVQALDQWGLLETQAGTGKF